MRALFIESNLLLQDHFHNCRSCALKRHRALAYLLRHLSFEVSCPLFTFENIDSYERPGYRE